MKKGILLVAILMLAACSLDVFAPPRGGRGGRGFVGRGMGWRVGGFRGGGWGRGWRHRPGWRRGWYGPRWRRGWYGYPAVYTYPTTTYVETAPAITYWTVRNDSGAPVTFTTSAANIVLQPGETRSLVNTGDFSINGQWYSTNNSNISIAPDGTPYTF